MISKLPRSELLRVRQLLDGYRVFSYVKAARETISAVLMVLSGLFVAGTSFNFNLSDLIMLALGAILAGLGIVKIFTIQHDCGHMSFTGNKMADLTIGRLCSVITLIPFSAWRIEHQQHHAAFCNIQRRTFGDVYVMSVPEFKSSSLVRRIAYRVFRSRLFILGIAPLAYPLIRCRFAVRGNAAQRRSAATTNFTLAFVYLGVLYFSPYLLVVLFFSWHIAGTIAMLIFYNEHQFEESVWMNDRDWTFERASVAGSSVILLPTLLSWITGNIGYHHIHHISPRIPSYNMRRAFQETSPHIPHTRVLIRQLLFPIGFLLWSPETNAFVRRVPHQTEAGTSEG